MSAHALDVSGAAEFERQVLEESRRRPVVVDFWAPWCGPCRSLKPILEKLADEYGGKFLLAKVNADENQELSARYGVRGIPAVKAFSQGRLADEFSGALPEAAVREFLDLLVPKPAEVLRLKADEQLRRGDATGALKLLAEAAALDPANEWVRVDAAAIMLDMGELAEAQRLLQEVRLDDARVVQLRSRLEFAQAAASGESAEALAARIARNSDDLQARLQLAKLLAAARDYAGAMEQMLEVVRRDRCYGDDAGRRALLAVFELLGPGHPLVGEYRRRLASALN